MSRVFRRSVLTAGVLTVLFVLFGSSRTSARQYSGGTSLTGQTFCLTSDDSSHHLCLAQNSGWYSASWDSPSLNSNCTPRGVWDAVHDQECSEQFAQGTHSDQSNDGTSSAYLRVQSDGNVVLYRDSSFNNPVWSTSTSGFSGATLELLDSGQLDVNYFGSVVWSIR